MASEAITETTPETTAFDAPVKTKTKKSKWKPPIAVIHTHLNIVSPNGSVPTDPAVLVEEQLKVMTRFIEYHERQARVGKSILGNLILQQEELAKKAVASS